jgi:Tfp pilus assembly protein FimT
MRRRTTPRRAGLYRDESGVTLVDLLLVLMIVAITGLVGSVSLQGLVAGSHARQAAKQVAATLQMARVKAISQHTPYKVTFTAPTAYQVFRQTAGTWVAEGSPVTLPAGVRFGTDGASPTTFANPVHEATFHPSGAATNPAGGLNGGTIYVKGAGAQQQYRVSVVDLTGRIQVWKGWD